MCIAYLMLVTLLHFWPHKMNRNMARQSNAFWRKIRHTLLAGKGVAPSPAALDISMTARVEKRSWADPSRHQHPCGNVTVYCPEGSKFPQLVGAGHFSDSDSNASYPTTTWVRTQLRQ
jgi:hypothetical protein